MENELNEVMGKIYSNDLVQSRIDDINVDSGVEKIITLRETFCDPRYRIATFIGVSLSVMQ